VYIKNISETKMEDFTFVELKNIAREEGLCGLGKFKKQDLYDFLISNNIDVTKYISLKPSTSICAESVSELKNMLNTTDEKERYRSLFRELFKKKEDLVRQAKKLSIDINKPDGKPKTIKQLLEDIVLKLGVDNEDAPKNVTNRSKKQDPVRQAKKSPINVIIKKDRTEQLIEDVVVYLFLAYIVYNQQNL